MTTSGRWPGVDDYEEPIQNSHVCFADPELKTARIVTDKNGLPVNYNGASATVYRATLDSGAIAIRCFTKDVPAVRTRYRLLGEHLKASGPLPSFLVSFTYLDDAIMVGDSRYPVLRMDWSEGTGLSLWVKNNVSDSDRVRALAETWRDVMDRLDALGLAHGDLAADNCVVRDESDITLIDYDSCYITGLADADSGEAGHPEFQHPSRRSYYGPNMDAFPALVIYLSLRAIAADPALLHEYGSNYNLVFTADDFVHSPGREESEAKWRRLRNSPDPLVRALTGVLADMCVAPIENLPRLSQAYKQVTAGGEADADLDWLTDPVGADESYSEAWSKASSTDRSSQT